MIKSAVCCVCIVGRCVASIRCVCNDRTRVYTVIFRQACMLPFSCNVYDNNVLLSSQSFEISMKIFALRRSRLIYSKILTSYLSKESLWTVDLLQPEAHPAMLNVIIYLYIMYTWYLSVNNHSFQNR